MPKKDYYKFTVSDDVPVLSPEEKEKEKILIFENINLIVSNLDLIISNEHYFYTKTSFTFIATTITGTTTLYMGIMSLLWKNKHFIDVCIDCGGKVYILGAGGSPLSGSHQWRGCCSGCKEIRHGRKKSFGLLLTPALELTKKYSNYSVIRRYNLKSKEWFNKLKEKRRPEEVIKKKKEGVSLDVLIKELQSHKL